MCIANLDGFYMDWALEVQTYAQIEGYMTFGNLKRVDIFRVIKEALKTNEEVTKSRDGG
jgi:hypothetical protein